ncbi:hypothetical protein TVAG_299130 [Trichomonas vaginalis G3]|uniref:Uncharacterized protein n=1 Tax=Trichomonas vaginalis (strain ATCC PRA-98 / G3) TaxID=412133 RepID=A2EVP1_TRIV3|nr:hypothetical protein TVAGG3_0414570 [Trichomonas vaginalis G3]EAY03251.1 hypothetical protein TVAG_299130 [Trichomonas vaginalis G3]KAI5535595.1 hypothetical protein TVAGG3_0414570 [Trichomonas vaginalis G3]|eukprot:XP_001315474.1 hypothetical protein [Trichomonas vaginalis G3]
MTDLSIREKNVSRTFAIAMSIIQSAIKARHNGESQQILIDDFTELLDLCRNDLTSAAIPKNERLISLMDRVNKERVNLIKDKIVYQRAGFAQVAEKYDQIIAKSVEACAYISQIYQNNQKCPVLPLKKFQLNIPVVHESVPPETIYIKFNEIKLPPGNYNYNIKVTHPLDENNFYYTPKFKVPGQYECSFSGLNTSKPAKLRQTKVVFEIIQKTKFIITKKTPIATYELHMREFEGKTTQEVKIPIKFNNDSTSFYVTFTAQMRQPFAKPEFQSKIVEIHSIPNGTAVEQQQKPAAPQAESPKQEQAPAKPKPKPKPAAKPQPKVEIPQVAILPDWEWDNFVCPITLQYLIEQGEFIMNMCKSRKVPVQEGLEAQYTRAKKEMDEFTAKAESGEFNPEIYIEQLKKSIAANTARLKTMDKNDNNTKEFEARINMAQGELNTMLNPPEDDE